MRTSSITVGSTWRLENKSLALDQKHRIELDEEVEKDRQRESDRLFQLYEIGADQSRAENDALDEMLFEDGQRIHQEWERKFKEKKKIGGGILCRTK